MMEISRNIRFMAVLFVALGAAAGLHAGPASAQSAGFTNNPDQPIEIEADALEVEDSRQTATFTGNVLVVQGDVRMKSDRLTVFYARRPAGAGGAAGIDNIKATGNVHVTSADDQSASGQWANYKVGNRQIEMGDSVVLRQGENVIRGARLFVDLNSGLARVSGGGSGDTGGTGRVKGLFHPSGS